MLLGKKGPYYSRVYFGGGGGVVQGVVLPPPQVDLYLPSLNFGKMNLSPLERNPEINAVRGINEVVCLIFTCRNALSNPLYCPKFNISTLTNDDVSMTMQYCVFVV